jgi:hypothetical protein
MENGQTPEATFQSQFSGFQVVDLPELISRVAASGPAGNQMR